jgi:hypothetical protein
MLPFALSALVLLQAPPQELPFPERLKAAGSREILEVPLDVKAIEEKSLPLDALRSDIDMPVRGTGLAPLQDSTEKGQRGMRLLAFLLQPKERLTVKLLGPDAEKVQLSLAPPVQQSAMTGEINLVNRKPHVFRSRNLQIRNVLDQPYTILLRVSGFIGYGYKLEVAREK